MNDKIAKFHMGTQLYHTWPCHRVYNHQPPISSTHVYWYTHTQRLTHTQPLKTLTYLPSKSGYYYYGTREKNMNPGNPQNLLVNNANKIFPKTRICLSWYMYQRKLCTLVWGFWGRKKCYSGDCKVENISQILGSLWKNPKLKILLSTGGEGTKVRNVCSL